MVSFKRTVDCSENVHRWHRWCVKLHIIQLSCWPCEVWDGEVSSSVTTRIVYSIR